jgi:hypothetical protein
VRTPRWSIKELRSLLKTAIDSRKGFLKSPLQFVSPRERYTSPVRSVDVFTNRRQQSSQDECSINTSKPYCIQGVERISNLLGEVEWTLSAFAVQQRGNHLIRRHRLSLRIESRKDLNSFCESGLPNLYYRNLVILEGTSYVLDSLHVKASFVSTSSYDSLTLSKKFECV